MKGLLRNIKHFTSHPKFTMFYLSAFSENRYTVYRSVVLKNNSLGTVDNLQFLIFYFSD